MQYEQYTHEAVVSYLRLRYPNVLFNTDLSGIRLTMGQAKKAKGLRSSRAFPDLVIYEARGGYFALFIELKRDGVKIYRKDGVLVADEHIREQAEMLSKLCDLGYFARFAVGSKNAIDMIDWYFGLPKTIVA